MNKADLVAAVHARHPDPMTPGEAVAAVLNAVAAALADGDDVSVTGMGRFRVVERRARKGRNPRTGESVDIGPRKVVVFQPGTALARAVAEGRLPDRPITVRKPARG